MPPSSKRRKLNTNSFKNSRVEEITFDPAARQEYLTGFHKRKQQRIQNAREAAVKREREERVQERRQIREQRKDDLVRHVAEVNAELRKQNSDLDDVESQEDGENENVEQGGVEDVTLDDNQDEEYVDEDKYTTVTVEAMYQTDGSGTELEDLIANAHETAAETARGDQNSARESARTKAKAPKKKKTKFRYESKAERQTARKKQKLKKQAAKAKRKEG